MADSYLQQVAQQMQPPALVDAKDYANYPNLVPAPLDATRPQNWVEQPQEPVGPPAPPAPYDPYKERLKRAIERAPEGVDTTGLDPKSLEAPPDVKYAQQKAGLKEAALRDLYRRNRMGEPSAEEIAQARGEDVAKAVAGGAQEPKPAEGEPVMARGGGGGEGAGVAAHAGGIVPAHEQPIVDPRRQAALAATFPKEAAAEYEAAEREAQLHEAQAAEIDRSVHEAEQQQQAALEDRQARQQLVGQLLEDAHNTARDVAAKKIDPERFWKSRTTGQQMSYIIAAALGGFAKDHTAANFIQHLIDLDVEAQRADIEHGHRTVQDKMSVFNAGLQATQSMDLAQQHDIATKLQYAMLRVREQAEESQAPIVRARAQALLVQLERKQIEVGIAMNKYVPAQAVMGGAGAAGQILDVDPDQLYQVAPGLHLLVGKGQRQKLVDSQGASNDMLREADSLKALLGPQGDGIDSYEKYREAWTHLASIATLQPQTIGKGSGRSLGQLQIYMNKLGLSADPKEPPTLSQYYQFRLKNTVAPVGAGSYAALQSLQKTVEADKIEAINQASNGYVGRIVPGPPDRHGVSKLQFEALGKYEPQAHVSARRPIPTVALPEPAAKNP